MGFERKNSIAVMVKVMSICVYLLTEIFRSFMRLADFDSFFSLIFE